MPPTQAHPTRIETLCTRRGLRLTGQRRVIARILSEAHDHPDVEEVYRRANAVEPKIALSTVYRTVKLFADHGLLERHEFGAGGQPRARFEPAGPTHHDHLIDMDTGRVIEFCNPDIEALQDRIARELGYELVGHRLQLYGVRRKSRAPAKGSP
jgi:Fur family transcriptional regulator, ferric uptake regulator